MLIMSLQIGRQFHQELIKHVKENEKLNKKMDLIKLEQEQARNNINKFSYDELLKESEEKT